ncbi:AbrB/MazE/SpoVT family DNA-binding domain-containing protein [Novosphingobium sp.]|uniref:AbrB/MazE/SpoVT family DNA-binding domain-containing protein n=1 Tax=Novosphingobium sp. TaxID=1874826 RepID=UPI00286BADB8|nr:AbrB/MazE/SpoVT family DNA-binding domain-containing protein [Novosphingobium sp.]
MGKEYRAKVFKSGNSLALRLPKELGMVEGSTMVLREERAGFHVEPAEPAKRKFNIDKVWGCAVGSGLQFIKDEDRLLEERPLLWDDPEWRAKHMPGA